VKNVIIYLAILLCVLFRMGAFASPVLAPSAVNASLEYRAKLFVPHSTFESPTDENIKSLIVLQTKFNMGVFEAASYTRKITGGYSINGDKGVIALNGIKAIRVVAIQSQENGVLVTYDIIVEVLVHSRLLADPAPRSLKIFLPLDPANYYDPHCVEKGYEWPELYFAFWQLLTPNCQSHVGHEVQAIDAVIRMAPGPNPNVSPQYNQLMYQAKIRGELRIAILMGFNESTSMTSDLGRQSFEWIAQTLVEKAHFQIEHHHSTPLTAPSYELVKPGNSDSPPIRVSLSLNVVAKPHPQVFAHRAKWAFEQADIVVYLGHSELGESLDLGKLSRSLSVFDRIEAEAGEGAIHFNPGYQIFYFGACESLFWFEGSYELAKKGKAGVDIVSEGLVSLFATQNAELMNFLKPFITLKTPSWMEILKNMEKPLRGQTYFINVGAVR